MIQGKRPVLLLSLAVVVAGIWWLRWRTYHTATFAHQTRAGVDLAARN